MRGGGLKTTHRGSSPSFSSEKKKEGGKKKEKRTNQTNLRLLISDVIKRI